MPEPTVLWLAPFTVNAGNTKGLQSLSSPLGLRDGTFLIAWTDDTNNVDNELGTDIIAQHFDALGNPLGAAFQLNDFGVLASETDVSMVALDGGGFAIAYEQNSNVGDTDILYEVFDANFDVIEEGAAALGAAGADQVRNPSLAIFSEPGSLVLSFERTALGDTDTMAVLPGVPGGEFDAAQNSVEFDRNPDSAAWPTIDFITVYEEDDAGTTSIEFHIRTGSSTFVDQGTVTSKGEDAHVAVLDDQRCIITWTTSGGGILGEIRGRDGSLIRNNFAIANVAGDDERSSDVVGLRDGGFFATWYDTADDRIEGARFDNDGNLVDSTIVIANGAGLARPELSLLFDGRVLVSFEDGGDIRAAIVDPRDDQIGGDANANVLTSRPDGATVYGFGGNDKLYGMGGDDVLHGGLGADLLDGGDGANDTADYVFAAAGVRVSLLLGAGTGGEAKGDTLINIEDLFGSGFNDVLNGGDGTNRIDGFKGSDTVRGDGGGDELIGGEGTDTLSYEGSDGGVNINLGTGKASGGHAKGDTFEGFENIKGSSLGDKLTGGETGNSIAGGGGGDTLRGQQGADFLSGSSGDDRLIGSGGIDNLIGGAGTDTFVLAQSEANRDFLLDFTPGNDVMEISATAFGGGLAAGALDKSQFRENLTGLAEDTDDRFIYRSDTKELFYDNNGSANGGHRLIAILSEPTPPDAGDFIIV